MKSISTSRQCHQGFTLVEMAVVLVIIGLIISGLLVPLAAQRDIRDMSGTQSSLKLISEAIYGFVVLNGRLPCPSTQTDPANANYGLEDAACSADYASEGYLPWKTLGVPQVDEWGTPRTAATDPWNGHWRYRIDRNFTTAASFSTNIITTPPSFGDSLSVQDSSGVSLTSTTERPIAIVYSTGKDLVANGQNASYEATAGIYENNTNTPTFDDILIWISRPVLVNRLVAAGKLP